MASGSPNAEVMRVGNGVLVAFHWEMKYGQYEAFRAIWQERFPDVPVAVIANARIVEGDGQPIMVFVGPDMDPKTFDELAAWWKEVSRE